MIAESYKTAGFALICSSEGKIISVKHDNLNLISQKSNHFLFDYFKGFEKKRIQKMLFEALENGASYNCEVNTKDFSGEGSIGLSLFCASTTEGVLVLGSAAREQAENLSRDMLRMNNEHVNKLRRLLKKKQEKGGLFSSDDELFDELSKLNNELANTKRTLIKRTAILEESNQLKNRMLGMAAHDLRNPLSGIIGLTSLILEELTEGNQINPNQEQILQEIQNSSEYMLNIVEDMLDVSAIEAGSVKLKKESVNLIQFLDRIISLNRIEAGKKDIELQFDVAENETIEVEIDPVKMQQVFNNLLSNAIKYSERNTTTVISISWSKENIQVHVTDRGLGIPEDEMDQLFVPFSKISSETTSGEKSTGLGLAIIKKIVEAHGGNIYVSSTIGEGSRFTVSLLSDE